MLPVPELWGRHGSVFSVDRTGLGEKAAGRSLGGREETKFRFILFSVLQRLAVVVYSVINGEDL